MTEKAGMRKVHIISIITVLMLLFAFAPCSQASAKAKKTGKAVKAPKIYAESMKRYDAQINWTAVKGAKKYILYRSEKDKSHFEIIDRGDVSTKTYYDDTMKPGKTYYYKVKETGKFGNRKTICSKAVKVRADKKGDGNNVIYEPQNMPREEGSVLNGKTMYFVGSSLTAGAKSGGTSFTDYLSHKYSCNARDYATSGTTTARNGDGHDFVTRTEKLISNAKEPDAFFCQMSANDATHKIPLGEITPDEIRDSSNFNTYTVAGAIEYIAAYAGENWSCPVVFYTAMNNGDKRYSQMIDLLYDAQDKWGFAVIDLYNGLNKYSIDATTYRLYMNDRLHPMKAGYRYWVTPYFEKYLPEIFGDTNGE